MSSPELRGGRVRLARWLIALAGAFVLLAAAAAVAVRVLFPPDKLRALVVPRLESALGREVELSSVRLRVFPRVAVRLEDLGIANPPGFSSEPALRLDALDLRVRLRPLLRREIQLNEVRLVRPEIRFEVREDGSSNVLGLGASGAGGPTSGAAAGAAAGAAFGLAVSDLALQDGSVIYIDRRTGRAARLSIDARLSADRAPDGSGAVETRGRIDVRAVRALLPSVAQDTLALPDTRIDYDVFADLAGDSVAVRELRLDVGDVPVSGSGVVRRLTRGRELSFGFESGDVDIEQVLAALPRAEVLGDIQASGRARISLEASGPLGEGAWPDVKGDVELTDVAADYRGVERLVSEGAGSVSFSTNSLTVRSFKGRLMGRPFDLELTLSEFENPIVDGRANGEFDIAQVLAIIPDERFRDVQASGQARFSVEASGPVRGEDRPEVKGELELSAFAADYAGVDGLLSEGTGSVSFTTNSLSVRSFKGQLLGRPVDLQLTASELENPVVEGRVRGEIDLARLAALRETAPPVEGIASLDLEVAGPVKTPEKLRLTGPAKLANVIYRSPSLGAPARIRSGTIRFRGADLSVEELPIELGSSDFTLTLTGRELLPFALSRGSAGSTPSITFNVTSKRLNMGELLVETDTTAVGYSNLVAARLAGRSLGGRDPAEIARERYTLPPLPPVQATGRVRIAELLNPPTEARDVVFDVVVTGGRLEIRNVAGKVYDGTVDGSATLDFSSMKPPFPLRYNFSLAGGRADAFVGRWTRLGSAITGGLDFNIAGTAEFDGSFLPVSEAIDADGRAVVSNGRFQDFGLTRALVQQLKIDPGLVSSFQKIGGAFQIERGAFVLEGWRLSTPEVTGSIAGSAGLNGSLDLKLALDVPASVLRDSGLVPRTGGLNDLMNRLAGRNETIELSIGIGGTMSKPVFQLDTDALGAALEKELQKAGEDLLKRLFRPPR